MYNEDQQKFWQHCKMFSYSFPNEPGEEHFKFSGILDQMFSPLYFVEIWIKDVFILGK